MGEKKEHKIHVQVDAGVKVKMCRECLEDIIAKLNAEKTENHSDSFKSGINTAIMIIKEMY